MSAPASLEPRPAQPAPAAEARAATRGGASFADYAQLTKPRITAMVVVTTAIGYLEGRAGPVNGALLLHALIGTALVAGAASAFNQWKERGLDALMDRTARRPLPAGRLSPHRALAFAALLFITGTAYLALLANPLASLLAVLTTASYVLAYTPLKQVTSLATVIGAVPGAIPPMIGWAAARDVLDPGAWALFLIVFFWQMPHFLAIAALCRHDYARAGIQVLPVVDQDGISTARQSVLYAAALLPVSVLPAFLGMAGPVYLALALVLGGRYVALAVRLYQAPGDAARARQLFRWSLVYLPVLLGLLLVA